MCGIAGILGLKGQPARRERIKAMTDAMAHRGRDSVGFAIGGEGDVSCSSVALGHRRLSIIDLTEDASQPMYGNDRKTCIVFNGELYNYRKLRQELRSLGAIFRTESDTEVILAAYAEWGRGCLTRFNGMFAFAIWDENRQSLFCARDALGIKPFYYRLDADFFQFSSESRSLACKELNQEAIAAYFFSAYVPRELSIYAGVRKLLPGWWMELDRNGRCTQAQWWNLPAMAVDLAGVNEAAERLQAALDESVKLQLQSDVPVGALLSGGFDSGMLVASAARQGANLHTYTVGFDDDRQFNELPIAARLAQRYGCIHRDFNVSSTAALGFLDKALSVMSEPVADSAVVPTWFLAQQAAADGVKVLLSGAGGDEVFGGYSRYVASSWRRKLIYTMPGQLRSYIGELFPKGNLWGARLRNPSLDMAVYAGGSPRLTTMMLGGSERFGYFLESLGGTIYPPSPIGAPMLYRNMSFDLQVYLPDLLLMSLDQLCMAHTVEGRVPLLDVNLVALAFGLRPWLHANPRKTTTRYLMRVMAKNRIDNLSFNAPKQGFSGPVRKWIGENESVFRDRTLGLEAITGLENLKPRQWWDVPRDRRNATWAHEVFLMYAFSTWYQSNHYG